MNGELYSVVSISVVVITLIIVFFIVSIVREHKKVVKWQQSRIAAEINTLENERKRIADDLHDELGPLLSAIKLQLNHLEPASEAENIVLEKSSEQIDSIIQRFREISYDLLPNTLVRKGFVKATEEFISKLKPVHPVNISIASCEFSLSPQKEVSLYRILQEIIHNTIKHSRATMLQITIQKKNNLLLLRTKDDGVGFSYSEKVQIAQGIGLLSIQSRVELLGAQLSVITHPGSGTLFEIEMPI